MIKTQIMSRTTKLPTFPVKVVAECLIGDHPWKVEQRPNDVRFYNPGVGAEWFERFEGAAYLDALTQVKTPKDLSRFLYEYGNPGSHTMESYERQMPNVKLRLDKSTGKLKQIVDGEVALHYSRPRMHYLDFSEFKEFQQAIKRADELPIEKWDILPFKRFNVEQLDVRLSFEQGNLTGECRAESGVVACVAQLFLEKLSGAQHGWCARPDCDRRFRIESKHDRKYCSSDCAHVMAVRAARERKRTKTIGRRKKVGSKKAHPGRT